MVITKAEALAMFGGNQAALARALNIRPQAVQQWPAGPIPRLRQFQLREKFPRNDFSESAVPSAQRKKRAA